MQSAVLAPRADAFPSYARPLDADDARIREFLQIGFDRAGIELEVDGILVGCVYDDGEFTHICAWRCVSEPSRFSQCTEPICILAAHAHELLSRPAIRFPAIAALIFSAYLLPSPFDWDECVTQAMLLLRSSG